MISYGKPPIEAINQYSKTLILFHNSNVLTRFTKIFNYLEHKKYILEQSRNKKIKEQYYFYCLLVLLDVLKALVFKKPNTTVTTDDKKKQKKIMAIQ